MSALAAATEDDLARFLGLLWQPGDVREVRIPKHDGRRTASGYFDDPGLLADAAAAWDGRANLYITLNPVNPALHARAANRIERSVVTTTADVDIVDRRSLYIDVDPKRPAGISASDAESVAARDVALAVLRYLDGHGWPRPIVAMTGNGYALLYRINLPNDYAATALVAGVLRHLAERFDNAEVSIDTTVSNAARIGCLVGTLKRKGDATADRPHRRSGLVHVPDQLDVVPVERLLALVPATNGHRLATAWQEPGGVSAGWVREWLDRAGVAYREKERSGITWYRLDDCPFHPGEGAGDCGVGEAIDGRGVGKCFHNRGTGMGWREFREALGLERPAPIRILGTEAPAATDLRDGAVDEPATWPAPPEPIAYRGILGELVGAVGETTEADPVALLGTFITMFGAACGHWRTVHHGDWQAGNVFTILVGESGDAGRKGTSLAIAREIFRVAYPAIDDFWAPGLGSGEGLVGFLKRRQPDPDDKFRKVEHRMLLVESEFGRLLRVIAREGSTVSQLMREAYDGVPIGRLLAREDDVIAWHHVALIGHITPGELRGSLASLDKTNGFVNRGLWLCVKRARIVSTTVPAAPLAARYVKALRQAIVEAQAPAVLDLADGAKAWWKSYRLTAAAGRQGGLADALTARSATHIARVALIYVLADRATMVGVEHLEAAKALVEYGERSVRHVFGDSTGNRHADVLWRVLRETGAIPWEDVKVETGLSLAADREDAVSALVEYGIAEVVKVPRPGGGRPRRVIRRVGAIGTNGTNGVEPARTEGVG